MCVHFEPFRGTLTIGTDDCLCIPLVVQTADSKRHPLTFARSCGRLKMQKGKRLPRARLPAFRKHSSASRLLFAVGFFDYRIGLSEVDRGQRQDEHRHCDNKALSLSDILLFPSAHPLSGLRESLPERAVLITGVPGSTALVVYAVFNSLATACFHSPHRRPVQTCLGLNQFVSVPLRTESINHSFNC